MATNDVRIDINLITWNTTIKSTELSLEQLLKLVPKEPAKKKTLKELKEAKVLIAAEIKGTEITIYTDGCLICSRNDYQGKKRGTQYAVQNCNKIVYRLGFSDKEREEAWDYGAVASTIKYRKIDEQLYRFHIIDEDKLLDLPWWMPILTICEERLAHNANNREEYHYQFSMDGGSENYEGEEINENFNLNVAGGDTCEEWVEAEEAKNRKLVNHVKLMSAMQTLTVKQRKVIDLYFYQNMTESKIAEVLGMTQQSVNDAKMAGLRKLKKGF